MHLSEEFEEFPIMIIFTGDSESCIMLAQFPRYGSKPLRFENTIFTCELDGENQTLSMDEALDYLRKTTRAMSGNIVADAVVIVKIKNEDTVSVAKVSELHFQCTTEMLNKESAWDKRIRLQQDQNQITREGERHESA